MKRSFFRLAILAAVLPGGCNAQQLRQARLDVQHQAIAGPNVALASRFNTLPLVEPHISAHPGNNDHLLAAAMVVTDINRPYESCRLTSFVSSNGGASWKETVHDWWGYDPWTAIAENGAAVMSWIGTKGSFQDQYPIQFFTSTDGGASWESSVQTLPGMYDGTKLAPGAGIFYFATVRFRESEGADVVLYSSAKAGDFVELAAIDGKGERLNFCEPAIRRDGKVIVPYTSRDGAWVQIYDPETHKLSTKVNITTRTDGQRGYARLVVDEGGKSAFRDHVYYVRGLGNSGLVVNRSVDAGTIWEKEVRVDLLESSEDRNALVPSAAINFGGVLAISWVNQQDNNEVYFTASLDGGVSFVRPVRLAPKGSNPRTQRNGDVANKFPGGGHYLGLTARADGTFQAIWSDSRNGFFQLQSCNIRLVP